MERSKRSVLWRAALLLALMIAALVVGFAVPLPSVNEIRAAVDMAGAWGSLAFVLGYGLITLTPVPKPILSIAAGLTWGLWLGTILVWLGALLGAGLAFGIGRWLGRDAVERFTGRRLEKVNDVLRQRGLLALIGARLMPLFPFTVINYMAGLTSVSRRDYVFGTAVGILPATFAFVAIGAHGLTLGWPFFVVIGFLAALSIAGAIYGARVRRRDEAVRDELAA